MDWRSRLHLYSAKEQLLGQDQKKDLWQSSAKVQGIKLFSTKRFGNSMHSWYK